MDHASLRKLETRALTVGRLTSGLVLFLFFLIPWTLLRAATLEGRVVKLSDGDTITVLDRENVQHKIRLTGIDAPEKKQAFGTRSRENLSKLVFGKPVIVEWVKLDRYRRVLGKVLVSGIDANLEQVRGGFAWHYKQYEKEQSIRDRVAYAEAEQLARSERRGLWRDSNPVPPWEFRHSRRNGISR